MKRRAPHSLQDLLVSVRQLYGAMHRFDQRAAKSLHLNPSDLRCVNALEHGPLSPSELAKELGITRGAMTAMLDRLERSGLVERIRQTTDRRRYAIQLQGRFYRKADRTYSQLGRAIAVRFGDKRLQEIQTVIAALQALSKSFDAAPPLRTGKTPD